MRTSNFWTDKASKYTVLEFMNPESNSKIESETISIEKIKYKTKDLWFVVHGSRAAFLSKSLVHDYILSDFLRENYKQWYYYFVISDYSDHFYEDCGFETKEEALASFLQIKKYYIETFSKDCMFSVEIID